MQVGIYKSGPNKVDWARAEFSRTSVKVDDSQILKAKKNVRSQFETVSRCRNHLSYFIKLQKAVPRFEVGLLFCSIVKLVGISRQTEGLRLFLFQLLRRTIYRIPSDGIIFDFGIAISKAAPLFLGLLRRHLDSSSHIQQVL